MRPERSGGRCSARPGGSSASTSGPRTWRASTGTPSTSATCRWWTGSPPAREFSDLLWELQGELGTSHAYEIGGEYRPGPDYTPGPPRRRLGADARRRLPHRRASSTATPGTRTPPRRSTGPGLDVRPGDAVLAINGQPVGAAATPGERLVNQADQEVLLTRARGDERARTVTVKALARRAAGPLPRLGRGATGPAVHERPTAGSATSTSPTWARRATPSSTAATWPSTTATALIVDVRFNGGGHVSRLLLEKLARRRLGYDFPRWGAPEPYPRRVAARRRWWRSPTSYAGSDGDIFSHTFKLLKLGPAGRQAHLGRRDRHLAAPPPGRRHRHHAAGVLLLLRRRRLAGRELRHRPRHRGRHHARRTTPAARTPSSTGPSRWRSTCSRANPYTLLIHRIGRACNLSHLSGV